MNVRQSYSDEFKNAVVAKILRRGGKTITEVCNSEGVGVSAANNWLRKHARVAGMVKQKSNRKWSAQDKLKAVSEMLHLSEEELGKFLRKEGLHSHQLNEWREEILASLNIKKPSMRSAKDERDQRIAELEKDLARKDKALAEASALLILQKKVDLIWGRRDEGKK